MQEERLLSSERPSAVDRCSQGMKWRMAAYHDHASLLGFVWLNVARTISHSQRYTTDSVRSAITTIDEARRPARTSKESIRERKQDHERVVPQIIVEQRLVLRQHAENEEREEEQSQCRHHPQESLRDLNKVRPCATDKVEQLEQELRACDARDRGLSRLASSDRESECESSIGTYHHDHWEPALCSSWNHRRLDHARDAREERQGNEEHDEHRDRIDPCHSHMNETRESTTREATWLGASVARRTDLAEDAQRRWRQRRLSIAELIHHAVLLLLLWLARVRYWQQRRVRSAHEPSDARSDAGNRW